MRRSLILAEGQQKEVVVRRERATVRFRAEVEVDSLLLLSFSRPATAASSVANQFMTAPYSSSDPDGSPDLLPIGVKSHDLRFQLALNEGREGWWARKSDWSGPKEAAEGAAGLGLLVDHKVRLEHMKTCGKTREKTRRLLVVSLVLQLDPPPARFIFNDFLERPFVSYTHPLSPPPLLVSRP
jgi:hypothetical protein